jgi:hypothetical protein
VSSLNEDTVLVVDAQKRFIEYIHPAIARKLLKHGYATTVKKDPFSIMLTDTCTNMFRDGSVSSISAILFK